MLRNALRRVYRIPATVAQRRKGAGRANRFYSQLLKNPDVRPPTPKQKRAAMSYAREVLGSRDYYGWLRNYTAYRGEFVEGWIPTDFYGAAVLPKVNGPYRKVSAAKTMSRKLFASDLFPDRAYFINGSWFDVNGEFIEPGKAEAVIFNDSERAFLKRESSYQGRGIFPVNRQSFAELDLASIGNCVAQRAIDQHPWLSQIYPGAVATLRITTIFVPGKPPEKRASYLRLGQGEAQFVASARALRVAVIDDAGTLDAFASSPDWLRHAKHPNSGFVFAGERVPFFEKAVAICQALHRKAPQFMIIGWDVAITAGGEVEIMEWNADWPGIMFSEMATGPCFADLGWEKMRPR